MDGPNFFEFVHAQLSVDSREVSFSPFFSLLESPSVRGRTKFKSHRI